MARSSSLSRIAACALASAWLGISGAGCVRAPQSYALHPALPNDAYPDASQIRGSLSVERVDGGLRLVVVQLSKLPAPERLGPGLSEFVVWLRSPSGQAIKAGELRYDRDHRSGSLFATTALPAFKVQVTGERDPGSRAPAGVLLSESDVVTN